MFIKTNVTFTCYFIYLTNFNSYIKLHVGRNVSKVNTSNFIRINSCEFVKRMHKMLNFKIQFWWNFQLFTKWINSQNKSNNVFR